MLRSLRCHIVDPFEDGLVVECGVMTMELIMAHHQSMKLMEDNMDDPMRLVSIPVILEVIQEPSSIRFECVGFADQGARHLYSSLRMVKGIGRRSALAALESGIYLDTLRAVAGKDKAFLQSLPDIGPAKAQSIISHLTRFYGKALPQPVGVPIKKWVDAREELMSEGLTLEAADDALCEQMR